MFARVAALGRLVTARAVETPVPSNPSPSVEQAPAVPELDPTQQQQGPQEQWHDPQGCSIQLQTGHAAADMQAEGSSSDTLSQRLPSCHATTAAGMRPQCADGQSRSDCAASCPCTGSDMEDGSLEHAAAHAHEILADVHADAVVVLNVGGSRYTTTYGTMRAVEGSYLDALFSGRWEQTPRQKGEVFLDRDGEVFRYVLQYLRAVRTAGTPLVMPESATERALLRAEADYYGLPGLAELCTCYRGTGSANVHMALGSSAAGAGSSSTGVLASCMQSARRIWAAKEVEWAASAQLLGLKDLLLGHVLEAPLGAEQVDLIKALAQPEPGTCIEVSLQYYSFGDVRIMLEACICSSAAGRDMNSIQAIAEANTSLQAAATAACALAADGSSSSANGAGGIWPGSASRPSSPTQQLQQLTEKLAQAESAVAAGKRCATPYYSFSIRESLSEFVLTKRMPAGVGSDGVHEERQPSTFKKELARYSALHKLLVQQTQPSYAGLLWLLQREGFAEVQVATRHEQYFVGRNGFPGTKSVITFVL